MGALERLLCGLHPGALPRARRFPRPLIAQVARENSTSRASRRGSCGFGAPSAREKLAARDRLEVMPDLQGLFVPGEAVSLNLSCEHLAQAERVYYSHHNPGAYAFGKEVVRAVTGTTLVEEVASGLRHEVEGAEKAYGPGDRVLHSKLGLGVVEGYVSGFRLEVIFDSQQHNSFRPSLVARRITRAPADAPPPPVDAARADAARADGGAAVRRLTRRASRLYQESVSRRTRALSRSARSTSSFAAMGGKERLLLYLNRDTWTGEAGVELAEIVRAAWQRCTSQVVAWGGAVRLRMRGRGP